MIASYI
jgi:hypothetical protein